MLWESINIFVEQSMVLKEVRKNKIFYSDAAYNFE